MNIKSGTFFIRWYRKLATPLKLAFVISLLGVTFGTFLAGNVTETAAKETFYEFIVNMWSRMGATIVVIMIAVAITSYFEREDK